MDLFDKQIIKGAEFSECRRYRYALWRTWDPESPRRIMFVGLNPSTADEIVDDPTIRRCINFSKAWGYGGMFMLNAYGFRATDPKVMQATEEPVGSGNDAAFRKYRDQVQMIIAAWGVHCDPQREQRIFRILECPVHCLGTSKHGRPRHPLYMRSAVEPALFWSPDNEASGESVSGTTKPPEGRHRLET